MSAPVWLLDIDGVVNACTPKPDPNVWPRDEWKAAKVLGFPCHVADAVVDFIQDAHATGRIEIRWHTTWQTEAQKFADAFGLPTLPVAEAPEFLTWPTKASAGWWKRPAAERVLTDEKRPLIWTDDDITWDLGRKGKDEILALGDALLISPHDATGLTPKHLRLIDEFAQKHAEVTS